MRLRETVIGKFLESLRMVVKVKLVYNREWKDLDSNDDRAIGSEE